MSFNPRSNERTVPWYDSDEFFEVFSWLSNSELSSKHLAINRLKIWKERNYGTTKQCPIAIISTIYILHVMLQDDYWNWDSIGNGFKKFHSNINHFDNLLELFSNRNANFCIKNCDYGTEFLNKHNSGFSLSLQEQYCMSIIRIINLFVDQGQYQTYARSISIIATELGIPQILVEIRHQATHGSELPSLETCRIGGILMFFFLYSNYWQRQFDNLMHSMLLAKNRLIHFSRKLFILLKNLSFDWDIHGNLLEDDLMQRTEETLIHSLDKYSKIHCDPLLKTFLGHIFTNTPAKKKIFKYYEDLTSKLKKTMNKKKISIDSIDYKDFNNISGVRFKQLKRWVRKCYNILPEFYTLINQILDTIKNNDIDECILKDLLLDKLIEDTCPLCSPLALLSLLQFLYHVSNNLKLKILSKLVIVTIKDPDEAKTGAIEKIDKIHRKCKGNRITRLFYWLRLLLPELNHKKNCFLKINPEISINRKQVLDVILLMTFFKKIDKGAKKKNLPHNEKISKTINESKYSMLIIFSKMMISIPNLLIKNGIICKNYYVLNFIGLLSDLKLFKLSSNLLKGLYTANRNTYLQNIPLFNKFLSLNKPNNSSSFLNLNIDCNNNRGIIIEENGLTPLLKIGTSWDGDHWIIYDHFHIPENDFHPRDLHHYSESSDKCLEIHQEQEDIDYSEPMDDLHNKGKIDTKILNMKDLKCSNGNVVLRDMCLLKAEAYMRKKFGQKEILLERALNINWNLVKYLNSSCV